MNNLHCYELVSPRYTPTFPPGEREGNTALLLLKKLWKDFNLRTTIDNDMNCFDVIRTFSSDSAIASHFKHELQNYLSLNRDYGAKYQLIVQKTLSQATSPVFSGSQLKALKEIKNELEKKQPNKGKQVNRCNYFYIVSIWDLIDPETKVKAKQLI